MKFTWEVSDIQPGVRYGRKDIQEQSIIGYLPDPVDPKKKYCSISLEDGMVLPPETVETWVQFLNRNGYVPLKYMESMR